MNKYIRLDLHEKRAKTNTYFVMNIKSENILGYVRWYGAWRQYIFEPCEETLYNTGCLSDISIWLKRLNKEQKRGEHGKR